MKTKQFKIYLALRTYGLTVLFVFAVFIQTAYTQQNNCIPPTAKTILDVNNISALIKNNGTNFFDEQSIQFEVPKGSGEHTIFTSSLWIGGLFADTLYLSAMKYGEKENDFLAGALDIKTATITPEACVYYDKVWKVSKEEIDYHKANYLRPGYMMPWAIANWPAHGRAEYNEAPNLAPYIKVSNKKKYTPTKGDYPDIRGDEAVFYIMNDMGHRNSETGGKQIGAEILCMAYAYNSPSKALQNTIFYSYKIRNRGTVKLEDFYVGLFVDFDLLYAYDDYIGCDPSLNLAYVYDAHPDIHNPPVQGAMFLNQKMSTFMYQINNNGPLGDPKSAIEFYRIMNGYWRDGVPLTHGGTGYDLSNPNIYKFAFDESDIGYGLWTEATENTVPSDRRGTLVAGPFTFPHDGIITLDVAFPYARGEWGGNGRSLALLKEHAKEIQEFYNHYIGIPDNQMHTSKLSVYPNPTTGELRIENGELRIESVEVFDVFGRKVSSNHHIISSPNHHINLSHLPNGIYLLKATTENGQSIMEKITILK